MIQPQGTGTPPDATDEEPRAARYGTFEYDVSEAGRGAHRPRTPEQAETEVNS